MHHHSLQDRMDGHSTGCHSRPRQRTRLYSYQPSRRLENHGAGKLFHPDFLTQKPSPSKSHSFVTGRFCLPSPFKQLTQLTFRPDGSFTQKFEQLRSTVPLELPSGGGTIAGFWVTLDAKYIFHDETAVVWSVYGCSKGHPQST